MEFYWKKYQLPMLYLIGFGTGILYANFIAKNYVTMTGIFHEYFLNQYTQVKIINEDYLWSVSYTHLIFIHFLRLEDLCREEVFTNVQVKWLK